MDRITHVLFDLGGVVVELRGEPVKPGWFPKAFEPVDIWKKCLQSEASREFESGKINPQKFAKRIVQELRLQVDAAEFLEYFSTLPVGPYAQALQLIEICQTTTCQHVFLIPTCCTGIE